MPGQRRDLFKLAEGITNRRAVGYARFSSEMQRDGWTIQAQTGALTEHCAGKGFPLVTITKDEAKSGKNMQRAGLDAALDIIRSGEANVLMVCKLDRATRDAFDAFGLERELRNHGAALYCIEQNIDTSDQQAFLQFGIHALMAQHFRMNLSGETAKGKRARAASGLANGDVPYGYRRPTHNDLPGFEGDADALLVALRHHPFIVVPERAAVVRHAFDLYATGQHSDADVAVALNEAGERMVSKLHPQGCPFTKDTITAMLRDPLYCGRISYAGVKTHGKMELKLRRCHGRAEYAKGLHDAIIETELFERVQAIRSRKHRAGKTAARCTRVYLASNLVHCTVCHQPLRANAIGYRDTSRERGITCEAHRRSIPLTCVDEALAAVVTAIRLPEDWQADALTVASGAAMGARTKDKRNTLHRKLERLKELVKEGIIEPDEYRFDKAKIDAELATLEHEDTQGVAVTERAAALVRDLPAVWASATEEERRALVATVVEAVWCDLDKKRVAGIQYKDVLYPLRGVLPPLVAWNGTDEIRTRDLLRDRQACWATTPRLQ